MQKRKEEIDRKGERCKRREEKLDLMTHLSILPIPPLSPSSPYPPFLPYRL
jgi:hypothetical protein